MQRLSFHFSNLSLLICQSGGDLIPVKCHLFIRRVSQWLQWGVQGRLGDSWLVRSRRRVEEEASRVICHKTQRWLQLLIHPPLICLVNITRQITNITSFRHRGRPTFFLLNLEHNFLNSSSEAAIIQAAVEVINSINYRFRCRF